MKKNFFIAFEGLDGSGKSTQVKLLAEKLRGQGLKIYITAEPTPVELAKLLEIFSNIKWKLTIEPLRRYMLQTGWTISQIKQMVY